MRSPTQQTVKFKHPRPGSEAKTKLMAVGELGSQGRGTVVRAGEQRAGTSPLCRWEEVDKEDPERHHPDLSTSVLLGPLAL